MAKDMKKSVFQIFKENMKSDMKKPRNTVEKEAYERFTKEMKKKGK